MKITKAINFLGTQLTESSILLNNFYSVKVTGAYRARSLLDLNSDNHRYIAPTDFIKRLSHGLDIEYIEHQDLWLDIKIIIKTPLVVLSTEGAY